MNLYEQEILLRIEKLLKQVLEELQKQNDTMPRSK